MVKPFVPSTRDRLIDATLDLVAARGFDGTTVGDIEERAGLAPRSGALYKYFGSKLSVLEAGLERHLAAVETAEIDMTHAALSDIEEEIDGVARWLLSELDHERTITHVIEREGDRLPTFRDRMRDGVSDRGYRIAASFVERWTITSGASVDHDALAVLLIGALINFRRSTWTFAAPPLDLDDERFVATFVALCSRLLEQNGEPDPHPA